MSYRFEDNNVHPDGPSIPARFRTMPPRTNPPHIEDELRRLHRRADMQVYVSAAIILELLVGIFA